MDNAWVRHLLFEVWLHCHGPHRCDSIALDGKQAIGPRASYTHAQKMRASMTHVFSRVLGIGSQHWQHSTSQDGKVTATGNPSISDRVSTYMVGLRRRKVLTKSIIHTLFLFNYIFISQVKEGETTTSARAITPVSIFVSVYYRDVLISCNTF